MSSSNFPSIGEVVLDPSEKFKDEVGEDKFDQLLADGSVIDEGTHPLLWETLGGRVGDILWDYVAIFCSFNGTLVDIAGGGNFLLPNGTVFQEGQFEGTQSASTQRDFFRYSSTPFGSPPTLGTPFTIECSVHISTYDYHNPAYIIRISNASDVFDSFAVYLTRSGTLAVTIGEVVIMSGIVTSPVERWVQVVLDYDGSVMNLYSDGELIATNVDPIFESIEYPTLELGGYKGYIEYSLYSEFRYTQGISRYNVAKSIPLRTQPMKTLPVAATVPDMTSPNPSVPYRVVSDLYTPKIGDIKSSAYDKYQEDGIVMFDQLLCDGSEVDQVKYPVLYDMLPSSKTLSTLVQFNFSAESVSTDRFGRSSSVWSSVPYGNNSSAELTNYISAFKTKYVIDDKGGRAVDYAGSSTLGIFQGYIAGRCRFNYDKLTMETYIKADGPGKILVSSDSTKGLRCVDNTLAYTKGTEIIVSAPYVLGTWVHLAFMRDGDEVYLFMDGKLVDQTTNPKWEIQASASFNNTDPIYMSELSFAPNVVLPKSDYIPEYPLPLRYLEEPRLLPDHTPLDENYPKRIVADKGE